MPLRHRGTGALIERILITMVGFIFIFLRSNLKTIVNSQTPRPVHNHLCQRCYQFDFGRGHNSPTVIWRELTCNDFLFPQYYIRVTRLKHEMVCYELRLKWKVKPLGKSDVPVILDIKGIRFLLAREIININNIGANSVISTAIWIKRLFSIQGDLIGTEAKLLLPQSQWRKPKGYERDMCCVKNYANLLFPRPVKN